MMVKLSTSMRTYKTNLQGENWRVHFGMHIAKPIMQWNHWQNHVESFLASTSPG